MHVDTGHNFPETIKFRDEIIKETGETLIIKYVQDSIDKGTAVEENGENTSRNNLQTVTLLEGLEEGKYDCALGGARRDEEKARAKERFFSHRDEFGQWDPKNQRPELWNLYNGKKKIRENILEFSNFKLDRNGCLAIYNVRKIKIPSLYFSHKRKVVNRNGVLLAQCDFISLKNNENWLEKKVRCRTIGDMTCTGVSESNATTVEDIIEEVALTRLTEEVEERMTNGLKQQWKTEKKKVIFNYYDKKYRILKHGASSIYNNRKC